MMLALAGLAPADSSAGGTGPYYSAASIVNAASNQTGSYAPNTFVTIYGKRLAWTTRSLTAEDITGNKLPDVLPGTGVRVWVGHIPAHIYYVSPDQINFLLPANLVASTADLQVQVASTYGPTIPLTLTSVAPAIFQQDTQNVIAAHADGKLVSPDAPASPGEVLVVYATGLGRTVPPAGYGEIPSFAAFLQDYPHFSVTLDDVKLDAAHVFYSGVAPGFAGLYQINLRVPDDVGANPEICVVASGVTSVRGLRLPVRKAQ